MEKKCKNCEHYQCQRKVAKFLGTTISQVVNKPSNKCGVSGRNYPSGDTYCNCFKFQTWYALQNEIDKIREEKERKRETEREQLRQIREKNQATSQSSFVGSSVSSSSARSEVSPADLQQRRKQYIEREKANLRKFKIIPIILTILNVLLLIGGIVMKSIANSVINNNTGSSSYYAEQNIKNAQTTSTLGTVFIVVSIIFIVIPWVVWLIKRSKVGKL